MKQSALYQKHFEMKAHFEAVQGWALPMNFGSIEKEYQALRQSAGILDFTHKGKIKVSGNDRAGFLHNMFSNDIKNLAFGQARYATFLTPKGKIISDVFVYALPQFHLLECPPENISKILDKLNSFIITEDVQLEDITDTYSLLSIQGPKTETFSNSAGDGEAFIFKNSRLKNPGLDIWISNAKAPVLWEKLASIIHPAGFSAYEIVRIEDGIPEYGKELDETIIPSEALLENAISYTKGCYPGQEIVARIKYLGGVQKKLCGLILEGKEIPEKGNPILMTDAPVGTITSACLPPQFHKTIALGYIKSALIDSKPMVQISCKSKNIAAQIVSLPFNTSQQ